MGINAIEKGEIVKQVGNTIDAFQLKKIPSQKENVSELLSGSQDTEEKKEIQVPQKTEKNGFLSEKAWLYGALALITAPFAIYAAMWGFVGVLNIVAFMQKMRVCPYMMRKSNHLKYLKKLRVNPDMFKTVNFKDSRNLQELKEFARQLGIKIKINGKGENDVNILREILYTLTQCHNAGKGKIIMPKKLVLKNSTRYEGLANHNTGTIYIDRGSTNISNAIVHELGHVNDFRWLNRGDKLFEGEELMEKIRKSVSNYATTNPSEFVAEMYAKLASYPNMEEAKKHIPEQLIKLYHQLRGPAIPFIQGGYAGYNKRLLLKEFKESIKLNMEKLHRTSNPFSLSALPA